MEPGLRAVVATTLVTLLLSGGPQASSVGQVPAATDTPADEQRAGPIEVSLEPEIAVSNGTRAQLDRLEEAVARFTSLGLALPDLEVVFADDKRSCNGYHASFQPRHPVWRIRFCSALEFVYEHELAHAWERANLTDEARVEFMALHGFSAWADKTVPWNERAVEWVAVVVQQGLAGLPLPPVLSREHERRILAFELLTGKPAPLFVEWCDVRTVEEGLDPAHVESCPSVAGT